MQQEAWSFIQFLTSADALQTYHKKTNRPTSRTDMVTEQQTEPLFGVFSFQSPFAKSIKIFNNAAYQKVFTDAIQEVAKNLATPEEALTAAQQKITCIIRKEKKIIEPGTDCGI
jgi:ABC-type glycerol-3-phosphate transport system substrate-binding protein